MSDPITPTPTSEAVPAWAGREEEFHNYALSLDLFSHEDEPPCPGCGALWVKVPHQNPGPVGYHYEKHHASDCAYHAYMKHDEDLDF